MNEDTIMGIIAMIVFLLIAIGIIYGILKFFESLSKSNSVKVASDFVNVNVKKAIKNSQMAISKSYLTGCSWILVNEEYQNVLYTFRSNEELLITVNGIVEKGEYELIVDNDTILITRKGITEHFFIYKEKDDFLFLRKLSSDEVLFFANQTKYKDEIKSQLLKLVKEYYREV